MSDCISKEAKIDRIDKVCAGLERLSNLFANGTNESWCCGIGKNLLLEYKAALKPKKKEQKFNVGDYVTFSDAYKIYSLYEDFISKKAPTFTHNFISGGHPHAESIFQVVAVAKHPMSSKTLCVVQDTMSRQVFIFDEEGLEATK